jgi:DNA-directed RNA polymerase subunit RPC12/RpoP
MIKGKIKRIFADHWKEFLKIYGDRVRDVVKKEIKKMLGCGLFENGYAEYQCKKCGEKKKVAFRYRSRFCTTCGKVYIDNRAENMSEKLVKSKHRHMVFTIPQELRKYFREDRKLLSLLPECAAEVIKSWWSEQSKKENYMPGIVAVIHTFGRDLKWNPHVHLLVTEGAAGENTVWKSINYVPYNMLRKRWQKVLLDKLEEKIGKKEFKGMKNKMYKENKEGFYVYGKGEVKNEKAATQYVGRYTGRPPIAESRIISYDGQKVTFYYERHEDGKRVEETIDAIEFIKRLIVHIPDEQFKMIRYYGIYAQHVKQGKTLIKMVNSEIKELRRKLRNWRARIMKSFGYDPIECEKCGGKMIVVDMFYKKYGSVMEIHRKRIMAQVEKEMREMEEMYRAIREGSSNRIEPVLA